MPSIFETETEHVTEETSETEPAREVNLDEEVEVANPNADFNITPPPPPANKYPAKFTLGEKGVEAKNSAKVGNFLVVHLTAAVIASGQDYDGYTVYDYPNSIYDKRKGTSAVHSLMDKLGDPLPAKCTLRDMKAHVERVLNAAPVGNIELEWQAKERDPNNKRADKNGYVTLASRANQFPMINGIRSNFVKSERDGSPVAAQAFILAYNK